MTSLLNIIISIVLLNCFLGSYVLAKKSILRAYFPDPVQMVNNGVDPGKPLFLTPYLEKGDIKTAQKLSLVKPLDGCPVQSYSGLFTVNSTYSSNMFFWFYPAQVDADKAPVLLWLQGGPGGTSMFGNFNEHGPCAVNDKIKLYKRKHTWARKYSMLYIDNPVGTGFSFTRNDAGYATNEKDVAVNLYRALVQFFTLFPTLKKNDFYITGESYAGKYVPAIAYHIHHQKEALINNLKGVAIGDGFSDPPTMILGYADFLYQIGMLDENESEYFRSASKKIEKLIQNKKFAEAFKLWDSILNGDMTSTTPYFVNVTGSTNYYNFMLSVAPKSFGYYSSLLAEPVVRRAIHVGNLTFNDGNAVEKHLLNDILQSIVPKLADVMNTYKVMLYSGQLDIIVAAPLTEQMLWKLPWKHLKDYQSAKKIVWKINKSDEEVAGYVRNVGQFYQVIVRGGGHILPFDQPERSLDMIDRFITEKTFV